MIPVKKSPQENNVNPREINVFFELFDANKLLLFGKHTNFFLFKPKAKIRLYWYWKFNIVFFMFIGFSAYAQRDVYG